MRLWMAVLITTAILHSVVMASTEIQAPFLQWFPEEGYYRLSGGVFLQRDDIHIRAKAVLYWPETEIVVAEDGIRYEDSTVVIEAERARIDLRASRGTLYDAFIFFKEDEYRIWAERVERLDENNYVFKKVQFTTCKTSTEAWCFSGSEASLTRGESLSARDVFFKVRGVSVLYSPYVWSPVLRERKSGLLMPSTGYSSRRGLWWRQPIYFVLSTNRDITFYLETYTRTALGEAVEYRYIEKGFGEGKWWLYHLRDWDVQRSYLELRGSHRYTSRQGLSGFVNVNLVNRKEFYDRYANKPELWSNRYTESTGELYYSFPWGRVFSRFRLWQDITPEGNTGLIVQRTPELGITVYPFRLGLLNIVFGSTAGYYYTEDLHKTTRVGVTPGVFLSYGQSLRFSQQVVLHQALYRITGTEMYKDTVLNTTVVSESRFYLRLKKSYGAVMNILEPEVLYRYVSGLSDDLPVLDSRELLHRASVLEAALRGTLYGPEGQIGAFRISGQYELRRQPVSRKIRLEVSLQRPFVAKVEVSYSLKDGAVEDVNYTLGRFYRHLSVSIGQRYSRRDDILFYTGSLGLQLTSKTAVNGLLWYDARGDGLQNLQLSGRYNAGCWWIDIVFSKRPEEYILLFTLGLKGLGEIRIGDLL